MNPTNSNGKGGRPGNLNPEVWMTPGEIMEKWPELSKYALSSTLIGWMCKAPFFEVLPWRKGFLINIHSFNEMILRASTLRVITLKGLPDSDPPEKE